MIGFMSGKHREKSIYFYCISLAYKVVFNQNMQSKTKKPLRHKMFSEWKEYEKNIIKVREH